MNELNAPALAQIPGCDSPNRILKAQADDSHVHAKEARHCTDVWHTSGCICPGAPWENLAKRIALKAGQTCVRLPDAS